ncbi:MAG: hypothetical protein AAGI70_13090 [Pseudomonadota bacterium]
MALAACADERAARQAAIQPADQEVSLSGDTATVTGWTETPILPDTDPRHHGLVMKAACQVAARPEAQTYGGLTFLGGEGIRQTEVDAGIQGHKVPLVYRLSADAGSQPTDLLLLPAEKNDISRGGDGLFVTDVRYDPRPGPIPLAAIEAECEERGLR